MSLSVQVDEVDDLAVVHVVGRIDSIHFATLADALTHLLQNGRWKIVLDCQRLVYLNTAEVPLLFEFESKARANGGDLKWAGLSEQLATIVHLLNGHHEEILYRGINDAMKAFEKNTDASRN